MQLILAFKAASLGSKRFRTHLIEMAAVAVHEIAVKLYLAGSNTNDKAGWDTWRSPEDKINSFWEYKDGSNPLTYFLRLLYRGYDQYPMAWRMASGSGRRTTSLGVVLFN